MRRILIGTGFLLLVGAMWLRHVAPTATPSARQARTDPPTASTPRATLEASASTTPTASSVSQEAAEGSLTPELVLSLLEGLTEFDAFEFWATPSPREKPHHRGYKRLADMVAESAEATDQIIDILARQELTTAQRRLLRALLREVPKGERRESALCHILDVARTATVEGRRSLSGGVEKLVCWNGSEDSPPPWAAILAWEGQEEDDATRCALLRAMIYYVRLDAALRMRMLALARDPTPSEARSYADLGVERLIKYASSPDPEALALATRVSLDPLEPPSRRASMLQALYRDSSRESCPEPGAEAYLENVPYWMGVAKDTSQSPVLRSSALGFLRVVDPSAALDLILDTARDDPDLSMRKRAIGHLGRMAPSTVPQQEFLLDAVLHPAWLGQDAAAIEALQRCGDTSCIPTLDRLARDRRLGRSVGAAIAEIRRRAAGAK